MSKTVAKPAGKAAAKAAEPKLDAKTINSLQELGINATTESDARDALTKVMAENGIEDSEGDSLKDLIAMAAVFVNAAGETAGGDADEAEEEEVVAPKKGAAKGKGKAAEAEMDELAEEVVTTGKGKAAAKSTAATKPAKKKANGDGGRRKLLGTRWEDLDDKAKTAALAPFLKLLPPKQFHIEQLQRSFTVKFKGQSSEQNIFKYHLLRRLEDGQLEGIFVAHRFKTPEDFSQFLSDELVKTRTLKKGDSCSYIHPLRQDEVLEILNDTDFLKLSIDAATKQDKKMKDNRDKLEEQLEETSAAATTVKGKAAPAKAAPAKAKAKVTEPEPEEEEEEEVVVPAKKVTVKVAATKPLAKPAAAPAKVAPKAAPAKAAAKKK